MPVASKKYHMLPTYHTYYMNRTKQSGETAFGTAACIARVGCHLCSSS